MAVYEGSTHGEGLRLAIVISRFNEAICKRLEDGAIRALKACHVGDDSVDIVKVPGAFEIPLVARKLAASKGYDAVICLGAVIRGETPHFDYVAGETARGITNAAADTGIPMIFGVLTTDTVEQAIARSADDADNKGAQAVLAAVEMATLMKTLR